MFVDSIKVFIL